jgi:hypothetical protein
MPRADCAVEEPSKPSTSLAGVKVQDLMKKYYGACRMSSCMARAFEAWRAPMHAHGALGACGMHACLPPLITSAASSYDCVTHTTRPWTPCGAGRLFPHHHMFRWLSYGNGEDG